MERDAVQLSGPPWQRYFPVVPQSLLTISILLGILVAGIVGLGPTRHAQIGGSRALDKVTYWVDPLILHAISLALVALIIASWAGSRGGRARGTVRQCFLLVLIMLAVGCWLFFWYAAEALFLKPAFNCARLPNPMSEPFLVGRLRFYAGTSCPSGFVLRQMVLLLLGLLFASGATNDTTAKDCTRDFYWGLRSRRTTGIIIVLAFMTAFVAFSRIYRGTHTWFDVGITIAASVYCFWLVYFICALIANRMAEYLFRDLVAASAVYLPLFLFYSQSATPWVVATLVVFCFLGSVHYIVRSGHHSSGQEDA